MKMREVKEEPPPSPPPSPPAAAASVASRLSTGNAGRSETPATTTAGRTARRGRPPARRSIPLPPRTTTIASPTPPSPAGSAEAGEAPNQLPQSNTTTSTTRVAATSTTTTSSSSSAADSNGQRRKANGAASGTDGRGAIEARAKRQKKAKEAEAAKERENKAMMKGKGKEQQTDAHAKGACTCWLECISDSPRVGEEGLPRHFELAYGDHRPLDNVLIGRRRFIADMWLDSPTHPKLVSRLHARLWYHPATGTWNLFDFAATNRTFVNGNHDLTTRAWTLVYNVADYIETTLRDGDIITFGGIGRSQLAELEKYPSIFQYRFHQQDTATRKEEMQVVREEPAADAAPAHKKRKRETEQATKEQLRPSKQAGMGSEEKGPGSTNKPAAGPPTLENKSNEEAISSKTPETKPTQCVCGQTKAGLLIRCDSCHKWFHSECVGVASKAKSPQLKKWQCSACESEGAAPPAESNEEDDDPVQWIIPQGAVVSCLPDPASGDLFWIAKVLKPKKAGQKTLQVRWFEKHPKRRLHYVPGEAQRIEATTLMARDVQDLLTQVGPTLYKIQDHPRLYTIK